MTDERRSSAAAPDPHLVMFDIDGTLVDTAGFEADLYEAAVRSVLDVAIDRTWRAYRHVTDGGVLEEIIATADRTADAPDIRRRVKRRFVELTRTHIAAQGAAVREIAGARDLVESLLAEPRARVAVATGGWAETASLKLRAIGLDPERFAMASGSDALVRTQIMRLAEQRALGGVLASRRTYFGDGAWDRNASATLGYEFVAVGGQVAHPIALADLRDRRAIFTLLGL